MFRSAIAPTIPHMIIESSLPQEGSRSSASVLADRGGTWLPKQALLNPRKIMVPQPGFELGTHALRMRCSTN